MFSVGGNRCFKCGVFVGGIVQECKKCCRASRMTLVRGNKCPVESCIESSTLELYEIEKGATFKKACVNRVLNHNIEENWISCDDRKSLTPTHSATCSNDNSSISSSECEFVSAETIEIEEENLNGWKSYARRIDASWTPLTCPETVSINCQASDSGTEDAIHQSGEAIDSALSDGDDTDSVLSDGDDTTNSFVAEISIGDHGKGDEEEEFVSDIGGSTSPFESGNNSDTLGEEDNSFLACNGGGCINRLHECINCHRQQLGLLPSESDMLLVELSHIPVAKLTRNDKRWMMFDIKTFGLSVVLCQQCYKILSLEERKKEM